MPNKTPRVRNLGQYGVITDIDPYDLPQNALSFAKNVRFKNNKISNGPCFKTAKVLQAAEPRFITAFLSNLNTNNTFVGYLNGTVSQYANGIETLVTAPGWTPSNADQAIWSSCLLGDLVYINRNDRPPWWIGQSNTAFATIAGLGTSPFPASACNVLRSVGGALVALGPTISGVFNPTGVLTSSFATQGNVPASWDYTTPNSEATLNTLAEMEGEIVDAQNLGNNLVIYSNSQTWLMTPDLFSGNIWDYAQLPFQKGVINPNCVAAVNAQHYVFGTNDIWVHDGVSEQSICDQRVREFIFSSINMSLGYRCFVVHNQELKELAFCYVSGDGYCSFPYNSNVTNGCNRAAIFSYATNTWTFDDLPRIFSGCRTNVDVVSTWSTGTGTWAQQSSSWQSGQDTVKRCVCYVGDTSANDGLTATLYAFDYFGAFGVSSFPVNTVASSFPYAERQGIALDDIGANLQSYKQINFVIPQGRIDPQSTQMILFSIGVSDGYNDPVEWSPYVGYDGMTNNIVDARAAGKYLSFRSQFNDFRTFTLSGFDLDVIETGLWR